MNVHEFAELSAGHALDALSPDDEWAFLEARVSHPEWAGIASADAATAAALADGAAEQPPPAAVRAAVLAAIGYTEPDAAAAVPAERQREPEPPASEPQQPEPQQPELQQPGPREPEQEPPHEEPDSAVDAGSEPDATARAAGVALTAPVVTGFDALLLGLGVPDTAAAATGPGAVVPAGSAIPPRPPLPSDAMIPPRPPLPVRAEPATDTSSSPGAAPETDALASLEAMFLPGRAAAAEAAPTRETAPDPTAVGSPRTEMMQLAQRRRWTRGLLVLAASLLVLVALGFAASRIGGLLYDEPEGVAALARVEAADDAAQASAEATGGGSIAVHWSKTLGEAVLVADGLPTLDDGQAYQAWYLRGDETDSAAAFATDASGDATVLLRSIPETGDTLTVTVEPEGGSEAPSSEPIATVPIE